MVIRNICNSVITFDKSKDFLQVFCSEIGPLFDSCEFQCNEFVNIKKKKATTFKRFYLMKINNYNLNCLRVTIVLESDVCNHRMQYVSIEVFISIVNKMY